MVRRGIICILGLLLVISAGEISAQKWQSPKMLKKADKGSMVRSRRLERSHNRIRYEYAFPEAQLRKTGRRGSDDDQELYEITVGNAEQFGKTGEPVLPVVPVQFILPAGKKLRNVTVVKGPAERIRGRYTIDFAREPMPLMPGAVRPVTRRSSRIYKSNAPYPENAYELVTVQYKRGVAIAHINIYPVSYRPVDGEITTCTSLQLSIDFENEDAAVEKRSVRISSPEKFGSSENTEELETYPEAGDATINGGPVPLGICNPSDNYRYVIITNETMRDATTDYTLSTLVSHKQSRGVTATIVTTEDIYNEYSGSDNQEMIRNFIIDAYANWETEFVLLGGDVNIIPARLLYTNSEEIPSDLYYQCLDGNYNYDGDMYWGEAYDGPGGTSVDVSAEVAIGRASAENPDEMSNFVYKTIAYDNESSASSYLTKAMLVGEDLGTDFGDSIFGFGCCYMREIHHGAQTCGYTTDGFDASSSITVDSLYEFFTSWTVGDMTTQLNSNSASIYDHMGHSYTSYAMKMYNYHADGLTNDKPFFIYSQGCYPGNFPENCIAEHLTTSNRHGAFAVVFNSRYGWGNHNSSFSTMDGPSQRMNRQFWDAYFSENILTFGEVNADSHEDNIWCINNQYIRWCMYETNLFGDPQLYIRGNINGPDIRYLSHTENDAAGNDDGIINPGETVTLRATVANAGTATAYGTSLTLSTASSFISITDDDAAVGDVTCCGASATASDDFIVTISSSSPTPQTVTFTLTAQDGNGDQWQTDFNIIVNTSNTISGTVTAAFDNSPLDGATVVYSGPSNGITTTDANGDYSFVGVNGTYSVQVSMDDFLPSASVDVTVPPDATGIDFALVRPEISVSPEFISETAASGNTASSSFVLTNTGDAPLSYTISVKDESQLPGYTGGSPTRSGGPDTFGNIWIDSDESEGPVFQWNDISASGEHLTTLSNCDNCSQMRTLSFTVPFYGEEQNELYICSNGFLTLGRSSQQDDNYSLPSASMPPNLIAPFFDDLNTVQSGDIFFEDFGSYAVVQYVNVAVDDNSGNNTFQVVIERNGRITFYYLDLQGTTSNCTVGIQNSGYDDGLNIAYNRTFLKDNFAIRIKPPYYWITALPKSGTIDAGLSHTIICTMSADELLPGRKTGVIELTHNDPVADNPLSVPCTLEVIGARQLDVDPLTLSFGVVELSQSAGEDLKLVNHGASATTVHSMHFSSNDFFYSGTFPLSVPAADSITLPIQFRPAATGTVSEIVTINSNAQDNPSIDVQLAGECMQLPQITSEPNNQIAEENSFATFSIVAEGSPLSYQWQRDGADITGATGAVYTITNAQLSDDGARLRCIVSNAYGADTSLYALLTVDSYPPEILSHPSNQTAVEGATVTFQVIATGSSLMYQWERNGTAISGATLERYTTPLLTLSDDGAQYRCIVSNSSGSETSNAATLTVETAPPGIVTHPADITVDEGTSATFTVTANGSSLSYQWRRNGTDVNNAASDSYTIATTQLTMDGDIYSCVVSNSAGSVTSNDATLNVEIAPPAVTVQPADRTVQEGSVVTFSISATGGNLDYQWLRNNQIIQGEISDQYVIPAASVADDGSLYSCRISNGGGMVTSRNALLTVTMNPPVITTHPVDQSVFIGEAVTFSVIATGSDLSYQWYNDNGEINGATSSIYHITSAQLSDDGLSFYCIVTNAAGDETSNSATLNVTENPPVITVHPLDRTVDEGSTVAFSVTATGNALHYQWQRDGSDIAGATTSIYRIASTVLADDGATFHCTVWNNGGTEVSNDATLTVVQLPPVIIAQPSDQYIQEGASTTFAVIVEGSLLTYQWQRDGTDISGANSASYSVTSTNRTADDGAQFTCVISNTAGTVTSDVAVLHVSIGAPVITSDPVSITVDEGNDATFNVTATGNGLNYQWYRNDTAVTNATSASLTITSVPLNFDGNEYYCNVSNTGGTIPSAVAILTVEMVPPDITDHPADQSVAEGGTALFTVTALGSDLHYQWQRNGSVIQGENSDTYSLPNVAMSDDGARFRCIVRNGAGQVASNYAELTIAIDAPQFTMHPQNATAIEGDDVTFSVAATGDYLSYQWERNGTEISGETGTTLTLSSVTVASDGDQFRCVITNHGGTATSNSATLTVELEPPTITTHPSDLTVQEGQTATFTVIADGNQLSYQWYRNGQSINGATNANYTTDPVTGSIDESEYRCLVENSGGSDYSTVAVLHVLLAPPVVRTHPANLTVNNGASAVFSITATGSDLSYQWQRDGADISGATASSFMLSSAANTDNGALFRCIVQNAGGADTSNQALLLVSSDMPEITEDPTGQTVIEGEEVSFSVTATGGALQYRWQKDGETIDGANSATYTISSTSLSDDLARFQCIVRNGSGMVISNEAVLRVLKHVEVTLSAGWNMISFNTQFADSSVETVFGSADPSILVKNSNGEIYWPVYEIDDIGEVTTGEGYKVYVENNSTIVTAGMVIDPSATPVSLSEGWNLIAYLPDASQDIEDALNGIESDITLVKNNNGEIYWPEFTINTIDTMEPYQAYQIHMKSTATLVYP